MRFHLRERAWRLTEDFIIRDDSRREVFEVRGKFFHIGDNLRLLDRSSGQELAHIKQRLISLRPSYDIYRGGQHLAHVHEQLFQLFGERFKVEGDGGMVFHIRGSIGNWHFDITDAAGNLLATVGHEFALFHESYVVDVAQSADAPFILALAIVIEMVTHKAEAREG